MIEEIIKSIKGHELDIEVAPISVSAFLTEKITEDILNSINLSNYELVLLPGFVQWDATNLENQFSLAVKKGPEFASDIPNILKNLNELTLSNTIPANKLVESSGQQLYEEVLVKQLEKAKNNLGQDTFYINEKISNILIGPELPPPIIAEIVNCTEKNNEKILQKVQHYLDSGADVVDIGCISNKPNPNRVKEIIKLIRNNFNVLISIDSMDTSEIMAASAEGIDMVLSLDFGNYEELINLPKDIPIVILPTNIKEGYFPKDPEERVNQLLKLTKELKNKGFKKLIADPLLETPIAPGICNSLETYFLYKKRVSTDNNRKLELPLFFGISNVVELMDVDSVGINGLLASIAIELGMGILFTVEHSTKLMYGVKELSECVKLNYLAKHKKTPPINQGIQVFKAKGKIYQKTPVIDEKNSIIITELESEYKADKNGYFKIHVNHYSGKIYVLFFSNDHTMLQTFIGENAEALSKKIIELNLTDSLYHVNYLGRELNKAENCLLHGKPYLQDE
jgi:dihydropteroate synthase-like protein